MKKFIVVLLITSLAFSCKNDKKENPVTEDVPVIALSDFNAKAGEWVGKTVQVEGIVDHVCKHGGKRLFLVDDKGDVHVDSDKRFDDALTGSKVLITGVVTEKRIDEAYLLQEETNFIKKHKEGEDADSVFNQKMKSITKLRDSLQKQGVDHFSDYSIEYLSLEEKK